MKNNKKVKIITTILSILPLIGYAIAYPTLPNQVPIHWNFAGEIDGYGSKNTLLLIPILLIGLSLLFKIIPKIDPKGSNYQKFSSTYEVFMIAFNIFMNITFFTVLLAIYRPEIVNVGMVTSMSVGVLFIVIGNYMPRAKQNFTYGIKTPWTLSSETVWKKTHRLGGVTFVISGVLIILAGFMQKNVSAIIFGLAIGINLIPIVMSYIYYNNEQKDTAN